MVAAHSRALIAAFPARDPPAALPRVELHLLGGYTTTMDVQEALYTVVPVVVAVTVISVVAMVGTSFGSVSLALRLVVTTGVSLAWTYGLLVLVYQPGPAQDAFAVVSPTLRASSSIYWIIPVMSFSILTGLALDYDIFIVSRVIEFRRAGWSDRAAVCLAVERTGGIITTAGLIMAVSFAGLLVPKTVVLNQYGFALFYGVLVDPFVIRPLLVPVVIALLGDAPGRSINWWPVVMPPVLLAPHEEAARLWAGHWEPVDAAPPAEDAAGAKGGGGGVEENPA